MEQTAPPRQLYDEPANEFVASFVGRRTSSTTPGCAHDIELGHDRMARRGPRSSGSCASASRRVDLVRDDGERLYAQLTRDEADELELMQGDIVYVRTRRGRTFSA